MILSEKVHIHKHKHKKFKGKISYFKFDQMWQKFNKFCHSKSGLARIFNLNFIQQLRSS